jgi:hypothetical protein
MRVTLRRLFAVALVAAMPLAATAAAPVSAPAPAPANKAEAPMAAARKALEEVLDVQYQARGLQDAITDLKERTKIQIILDNSVYQYGLDPTQPTVNVNLKQVKMKEGLKAILAPFNLKYGLTAEGLYVSTEDGVITRQLRQRVSLDCDGTQFSAAAKQLAADTGANVVVDPRLGEKANKGVTLKLDDVPLETAIRLLSEVADLRAIRMSNVLFITSPEKAEKLRPDADGPTSPTPINPQFVPGVVPGAIGGIAFPAPIAPPAPCPGAPPANPPAETKPGADPAPAPAPGTAPVTPPAAPGGGPATPPAPGGGPATPPPAPVNPPPAPSKPMENK